MNLMRFQCSRCSKEIAREVRVSKNTVKKKVVPCEGAIIKKYKFQAPRVRCACGSMSIIIKGSM